MAGTGNSHNYLQEEPFLNKCSVFGVALLSANTEHLLVCLEDTLCKIYVHRRHIR
jgi:hypothetical protein